MSGGSAFYVLIYAVFYFVNKVLSFPLYESATFLGEAVGFGKGQPESFQIGKRVVVPGIPACGCSQSLP